MASLHRTVPDRMIPVEARRGIGMRRRGVALPWLLLGLLVASAVLAGYYGYERHRIALDEPDALRGQLASAAIRAAGTDERLMKAEADLSRARGELDHAPPCVAAPGPASGDAVAAAPTASAASATTPPDPPLR